MLRRVVPLWIAALLLTGCSAQLGLPPPPPPPPITPFPAPAPAPGFAPPRPPPPSPPPPSPPPPSPPPPSPPAPLAPPPVVLPVAAPVSPPPPPAARPPPPQAVAPVPAPQTSLAAAPQPSPAASPPLNPAPPRPPPPGSLPAVPGTAAVPGTTAAAPASTTPQAPPQTPGLTQGPPSLPASPPASSAQPSPPPPAPPISSFSPPPGSTVRTPGTLTSPPPPSTAASPQQQPAPSPPPSAVSPPASPGNGSAFSQAPVQGLSPSPPSSGSPPPPGAVSTPGIAASPPQQPVSRPPPPGSSPAQPPAVSTPGTGAGAGAGINASTGTAPPSPGSGSAFTQAPAESLSPPRTPAQSPLPASTVPGLTEPPPPRQETAVGTAGQPASAPASFTSTPVSVPAPGGPVTVLAPLTAPVVPPAPSLASFPPAPPGVALAPAALEVYQTLSHPQSCGVPVPSHPQFDVPADTTQPQSYQGAVCAGTGISIPTGVIPVPKTYSINFLSSAFEEAEPMETNVQCGLDGDNFTDYTVGSEPGFVSQHGNYSFAVGGSELNFSMGGDMVTVPIQAFLRQQLAPTTAPAQAPAPTLAPPPPSPVQSPPPAPLLASPPPSPALHLSTTPPPPGVIGTPGVSGRRLLSSGEPLWREGGRRLAQMQTGPVNNFTLSVMVAKCSGTQPVDSASVAAIVNGYTATNFSVPLSAVASTPNLYQGVLDTAITFPDLLSATQDSISFCSANQANIQAGCDASAAGAGQTFANQTILLNACKQFLTNNEMLEADPQEVTVACAIVAIEFALICRTQSTVNCTAVAATTFNLTLSAEINSSQVVGTQMLPNFGSIFNGLLNGSVPASTVAGTAAISTANTSNAGSSCSS